MAILGGKYMLLGLVRLLICSRWSRAEETNYRALCGFRIGPCRYRPTEYSFRQRS